MNFNVYRYNPETDKKPYTDLFEVQVERGMMLREVFLAIQEQDESFTFRHSCGEGVCGSDGVNVNGVNRLACITAVAALSEPVQIRPLPGRPVIRDLVVDMQQVYAQYNQVEPWLIPEEELPQEEILQTPEERDKLDGLYECILCGCCTASFPYLIGGRFCYDFFQ